MRRSTVCWRARGGRDVLQRVERGRPLRQRREERRLRRRQHRRVDAEVDLAGAPGPGRLVAVRREVQVQRQDLALAEAVLEPQRQHHLADLGAERRAA